MNLGEKIRQLRVENHLSQSELAAKLKTSKQTIGKYETGIITNLPLKRIQELAEALNTTPAYLLDWPDEPKELELTLTQKKALDLIKSMTDDDLRKFISMGEILKGDSYGKT